MLSGKLGLQSDTHLLSASIILMVDWVSRHGKTHVLIIHLSKHVYHVLVSNYWADSHLAWGAWATCTSSLSDFLSWLRFSHIHMWILRLRYLIRASKTFSKLLICSNDSFGFWRYLVDLHPSLANSHVVIWFFYSHDYILWFSRLRVYFSWIWLFSRTGCGIDIGKTQSLLRSHLGRMLLHISCLRLLRFHEIWRNLFIIHLICIDDICFTVVVDA